MKIFLPLIFIVSIFSCSCKGTQYASPSEFSKKKIVFGSAGGYAGKTDRFTLLENGQLFHFSSISDKEAEIKSLPKKEVKAVLSQMKEMGFGEMDMQQKGNLNYFVEMVDGETAHACKWADEGRDVPESLKGLYKSLMALTEITE